MIERSLVLLVAAWAVSIPAVVPAQDSHMKHSETMHGAPALKPAQGASVKIISPKNGQAFKGDQVPVEFKLVKGKSAEHVHAYVDGELMGMFKGDKGTLTGIKPGSHTLELRAVMEDHMTELNASDRVKFVIQ